MLSNITILRGCLSRVSQELSRASPELTSTSHPGYCASSCSFKDFLVLLYSQPNRKTGRECGSILCLLWSPPWLRLSWPPSCHGLSSAERGADGRCSCLSSPSYFLSTIHQLRQAPQALEPISWSLTGTVMPCGAVGGSARYLETVLGLVPVHSEKLRMTRTPQPLFPQVQPELHGPDSQGGDEIRLHKQ